MTSSVVMVRASARIRYPEWRCTVCIGLIGPAAHVFWNAGSDEYGVTPIAICGNACEARLRESAPDVTLEGLPLATYIFFLAAGTATTPAVAELIEDEAYGRSVLEASNQPGYQPKGTAT